MITVAAEIVQYRLRDERHYFIAYAEALALLAQIFGNAASRFQPVSRTARKHDRVDMSLRLIGAKHIRFARAGRAAAHAHTADRSPCEYAGNARMTVVGLSYPYPVGK